MIYNNANTPVHEHKTEVRQLYPVESELINRLTKKDFEIVFYLEIKH